jgi:hypothetical protein
MARRRAFALAVVAVLAISVVGPTIALGQEDPLFVQGQPDLNVHVPDNRLTTGQTTDVELQISNDGRLIRGAPANRDIVTAARNVRVSTETDAPIEIETERQSIGTVTEDQPGTAPITVTVPEGTEPGTYEIDVELEYRHTSQLFQRTGVTNEKSRSVTETVEVEVENRPRFEITNVTTDAQIGDRGVLTATLENVGSQTATDTRLSVGVEASPQDRSMLSIGAGNSDYARAGRLEPGEQAVLRYDVAVDGEATIREFALEGTVQFTDPDGVPGSESGLSAGVRPHAKQQFAFENVESTLRVGEEGEIHGTVTNEGPATADSVVVRFADESPNVVPIEDSVAVGSLSAGESADFRLPIEVTTEAEAVPRNFDMAVAYRNEDDESRVFEDIDLSAGVAQQRDEFLVDLEEGTITAGSSTLVDVTVTNNLDETVTDVEAKLFTDDPLSSDDDEGYIESLDPGETTTVTFRVSTAASATPRVYPLQMDFRYDDEEGTGKVSDSYRTAVSVTESQEEGTPWPLVGGAALVLAIVVGVLYWRR